MWKKIQEFRRSFLDVRAGEYGRTFLVALYLLFILFAYYILKPVSRALFVNRFEPDKLPILYILIAPAGGLIAYLYSRLTIRASLTTAVTAATAFSIGFTLLMGYLIHLGWEWTYYVFNIWVSMFSIMMVTQGWVIAANVFTTREAKRLYGILGLGAVIGAAFGGSFTAFTVRLIGEHYLIVAAAIVTLLAYFMYWLLLRAPGVNLRTARATSDHDADFSFGDIVRDIRHYRHLQVIVGIVILTFIVDVMVEYQFQVFAKARYPNKADLTAFMGSFNGIYLNLVNFFFQFFLTAAVVRLIGVGGVLQIMPITISAASFGIFSAPGVLSTSIARLTEAATRYTFNRTGMELLYLPLPLELRNRVKAFLDIFVDRLGRGIGGCLLYLLTVMMDIPPRELSLVILLFTASWAYLSWLAQREYLNTVRRRLESRTLDLASVRVSANDRAMIKVLEEAARSENSRQAAYALSMLGSVDNYDLAPMIQSLSGSRAPEVRGKIFELAQERGNASLAAQAMAEIRSSRAGDTSPAVQPAVRYATALSPEGDDLAGRLLDHPSILVAETALEILTQDPVRAKQKITVDLVTKAASSENPDRRRLAAIALRALDDKETSILHSLLADDDRSVAEAALETAGALRKRTYLDHVIRHLGDPRLRGAATDALAKYGAMIAGTLRDLMEDPEVPMSVRLRIPRALERMKEQRAADALLGTITIYDLTLRGAILASLQRMRRQAPDLDFGPPLVDRQILDEAKYYFVLWSAFEPFQTGAPRDGATRLLTNTLEDRLKNTLGRVFYLLGLKYSPQEMRQVYEALQRKSIDDHAAAIEFLDSVLHRELKRVLMPLVDDTARLSERGHELFGVERKTTETALRDLIRSRDEWLVCCAIATAADLKLTALQPDIKQIRGHAGHEVELVASDALATLAA